MSIKQYLPLLFSLLTLSPVSHGHDDVAIFHAFRLEMAGGENRHNDAVANWDLDGWVGGDNHKLWLKSEGEVVDRDTESSETWALYSYNLATFWDVQAGVRYDHRPQSTAYFVAGLSGLAPYHFETDAHLFASEDGDLSLRLREENDVLLTQKLILQPYIEANVYAQDVPELAAGSGLSDTSIGVQLRYEFTRKIATYIDASVVRRFGDTAAFAEASGAGRSDGAVTAGIRLMF